MKKFTVSKTIVYMYPYISLTLKLILLITIIQILIVYFWDITRLLSIQVLQAPLTIITVYIIIKIIYINSQKYIKNLENKILDLIETLKTPPTLTSLSKDLNLTENELMYIIANYNIKNRKIKIKINPTNNTVSIQKTQVEKKIPEGKESYLQKLEKLYKEGKISKEIYNKLKQEYTKKP